MIKKSYFSTTLDTEVTYIKGVGPNRGTKLKKNGIEVVTDLLYHFPRRYIDRTNILSINKLQIGQEGLIVGKIFSVNIKQAKNILIRVMILVFLKIKCLPYFKL